MWWFAVSLAAHVAVDSVVAFAPADPMSWTVADHAGREAVDPMAVIVLVGPRHQPVVPVGTASPVDLRFDRAAEMGAVVPDPATAGDAVAGPNSVDYAGIPAVVEGSRNHYHSLGIEEEIQAEKVG